MAQTSIAKTIAIIVKECEVFQRKLKPYGSGQLMGVETVKFEIKSASPSYIGSRAGLSSSAGTSTGALIEPFRRAPYQRCVVLFLLTQQEFYYRLRAVSNDHLVFPVSGKKKTFFQEDFFLKQETGRPGIFSLQFVLSVSNKKQELS